MSRSTVKIQEINNTGEKQKLFLITISGQLDESNIDDNAKQIYELIVLHPDNLFLFFDLEKLDYLNSKSLGYFTDWYLKLTEKKGNIAFIRPQDSIKEILQAIGLNKMILIYDDLEKAKEQLTKSS